MSSEITDQFLKKLGILSLHVIIEEISINLIFHKRLLSKVCHDTESRWHTQEIAILIDQFLGKGIHGSNISRPNLGNLVWKKCPLLIRLCLS